MTMDIADSSGGGPASMPLAEHINVATRVPHAKLNKLIVSRLPLCLPPDAATPSLYLIGLEHIAEMFCAFEAVWDEITSTSQLPSVENTWDNLDNYTYPHPHDQSRDEEDPLIAALRTLRPLGVARSARLRNDIEYLSCVVGREHVEGGVDSMVTDRMRHHIETRVRENPHLLLAYAWTLYLAVFSGGRYLRAQLCSAGEDFWLGKKGEPAVPETGQEELAQPKEEPKKSYWLTWKSPVPPLARESHTSPSKSTPSPQPSPETKPTKNPPSDLSTLRPFESKGLSFWFFPGPQDGEELRAQFKTNFAQVDYLLSQEQVDEVVAEAGLIFKAFEALVEDLDITVEILGKGLEVVGGSVGELEVEAETSGGGDEGMKRELVPMPVEGKEDGIAAGVLARERGRVFDMPGYVGLALVFGCVSWYAMYHSGAWA